MKASDNRLDKVEEALIAAHRRQEDLQLPPEWRQQVLEDIKAGPRPQTSPQDTERKAVSSKKFRLVAALSFAVLAVVLVIANIDRREPWVALKHHHAAQASPAAFHLEAGDHETGLRSLKVTVIQREIEIEVLAKNFEPQGGVFSPTDEAVKKVNIPLAINTQKLGLQEGEVTIIIIARDLSWNNGFAGNQTTFKKTVYITHNQQP